MTETVCYVRSVVFSSHFLSGCFLSDPSNDEPGPVALDEDDREEETERSKKKTNKSEKPKQEAKGHFFFFLPLIFLSEWCSRIKGSVTDIFF